MNCCGREIMLDGKKLALGFLMWLSLSMISITSGASFFLHYV